MSMHLSSRQIDHMLAGENDPACQTHLNSCAACRAEFEQLRESLGHFRDSVRNWSGEQMNETSSIRHARPALRIPPLRGLALAAFTVLLLALTAMRFSDRFFTSPLGSPVAAPVSDAVLLNEIRLDVARPVAVSLEPLLVDRTP